MTLPSAGHATQLLQRLGAGDSGAGEELLPIVYEELHRIATKRATGGGLTVPEFEAGDPQVSAVSAAKGDLIHAGDSRYYLVYYRDPVVLGGRPASSTFNATQTGMVTWSP